MTRDERQEIARVKWIKNKCRGTIVMPTGVGKTRTALKCLKSIVVKYPKMRILVVVPTDNLKIQWRQQLDEWGMELIADVQIINTIIRHNWNTDILVLDECHRYSAETFQQVFQTVNYKYILGLTATLDRVDGKESTVKKDCPICDRVGVEEALLNKWVSPYKEYAILIHPKDINIYNDLTAKFNRAFGFFSYDFIQKIV